jgi:hypothetical protein
MYIKVCLVRNLNSMEPSVSGYRFSDSENIERKPILNYP